MNKQELQIFIEATVKKCIDEVLKDYKKTTKSNKKQPKATKTVYMVFTNSKKTLKEINETSLLNKYNHNVNNWNKDIKSKLSTFEAFKKELKKAGIIRTGSHTYYTKEHYNRLNEVVE